MPLQESWHGVAVHERRLRRHVLWELARKSRVEGSHRVATHVATICNSASPLSVKPGCFGMRSESIQVWTLAAQEDCGNCKATT